MPRTLHVAAAQVHSGGGVRKTLKRIERQVKAASVVGAEVMLFSECALHGYDYDMDRALVGKVAEPADGPDCTRILKLAGRYGIAILVGFFERDGDAIYNSHLVARPDGTWGVQRKHMLTPGEIGAGLAQGPIERTIFEFNGVKTAITICADSGITDIQEVLQRQGVEYRFGPAGGGGKVDEMLHESDLLTEEGRKKYTENRPRVFLTEAILSEKHCAYTGFTACNALGPVGKRTCHQGHCMIVDNHRVMRAQIPGTIVLEHMQDQMIHAELSFA